MGEWVSFSLLPWNRDEMLQKSINSITPPKNDKISPQMFNVFGVIVRSQMRMSENVNSGQPEKSFP